MDATTIINVVKAVTKRWAKQRKAEERSAAAVDRRRTALIRSYRVTIKDAAWEVMETAYLKASANGKLPARPRQIMYVARPIVLERTGEENLDGQYFAQTLLVDYMKENPLTTRTWDIAWDDRGHFAEPHTERVIGLGTLAVRGYLASVTPATSDYPLVTAIGSAFPTAGPRHRFNAILFIEKEGFMPLFESVSLAERFDVAIMSSKGLSTTAARSLVDQMCGAGGVPLLALRDFDKSGFSIVGTLRRNTRRYTFANSVQVIDLGLRLEDVQRHHLQSESVTYRKTDPAPNLLRNGATEAEIEFLCSRNHRNGYAGQRVELNSFTSDALVAWIEGKLKQHGIRKVVPDSKTLDFAFRRADAIGRINAALPELVATARREAEETKLPGGIAKEIQRRLRDNPAMPWDEALAALLADRAR